MILVNYVLRALRRVGSLSGIAAGRLRHFAYLSKTGVRGLLSPGAWGRAVNRNAEAFLYEVAVPLGRRRTQARLAKGTPRSLWGVTPILTLPLKARADRLLGFRSHSLVFVTYHITRSFDINLHKLTGAVFKFAMPLAPAYDHLLLAWALLRYDVFHFFYDRGLTRPVTRFGVNPVELDILRAAGKRVYLYAYGADVRRRDATLALGRWNFCAECPEPGRFCVCADDEGAHLMQGMAERVTQAVALGDMLAYVPDARNLHYWPIDIDALPPGPPPRPDGPLRIAHAPNHTHFKGSHYLEATIEKLRTEGHDIEYVKVQGVPNAEVIRLFGIADLVADQFLGGAFGYTALEAMARGKPVLTYVRSPDLVEAAEECPLINVTPDTLEATLRWVLANRKRLPAIGAQGRRYVERWHAIDAVADRLGRMYEDTADFPPATRQRITAHREGERRRRAALPPAAGWEHPFRVDWRDRVDKAVRLSKLPLDERWSRLGLGKPPTDAWASYDRTPWRHPWLAAENLRAFSSFSVNVLADLRMRFADLPSMSFGLVGNMANINYMRFCGLYRRGLHLELHLPKYDLVPTSQPVWENFDGDITELGPDPAAAILQRPLPAGVKRMQESGDWEQQVKSGRHRFVNLDHLVAFPEFMPYNAGMEALQRHAALLVTQFLFFGPLADRPYVVGPMGGEIWFDAARDDALGRFSRLALRQAYAVLVSNPITLAHARRLGLSNCLYLPFWIDEDRYCPGEESDIRAEWQSISGGGTFFVMTSMRLDNNWKGADLALEGFARFVRAAPNARLVVLGWGADQAVAKARLQELGMADKVLWLPMAGKARLARYLRAADALIEQFVLGYYGASGLEAIASGLPVIMRLETAQYDALVPRGAPPILHAADADAVAAHLHHLHADEAGRRRLGAETRAWFLDTHASSAVLADVAALLHAAAIGAPIDWERSPLAQPLGEHERAYQDDQLAKAPAFGTYEI